MLTGTVTRFSAWWKGIYNMNQTIKKKTDGFQNVSGKLMHHAGGMIAPAVVALILAVVAAILVIIGPNQLAKITDYMSEGLYGSINLDLSLIHIYHPVRWCSLPPVLLQLYTDIRGRQSNHSDRVH